MPFRKLLSCMSLRTWFPCALPERLVHNESVRFIVKGFRHEA